MLHQVQDKPARSGPATLMLRRRIWRASAESAADKKVKEIAARKGCTPGQLALAWVHAQGEDVFPSPGALLAAQELLGARGARAQPTRVRGIPRMERLSLPYL